MLGFGNNKKKEEEEKAKQEQIAQAMKAMSDQIAGQAQTIKQLQDQLTAAKADDSASSVAAKALAAAQAQLKQMHDEMEKVKASAAAATAAAVTAGKSAAATMGGAVGSAVAGAIGVTKIGPSSGASGAVGALGGPGSDAILGAAATGGLSVGATAYVQKAGGKNLRLRDAAGLGSNAFDALHPGTQMTLLAGPVEKDGYPWWHIRAADGREGWVAGTELVTHPE
ncbi:SH3 domain-containing protein [Oscillochloris sp. ZM17-4]|uniref:SH3 domain-containing protein n=1 Tax=Oscillochloris sp. ZM17-4 TaxID=2866714 RepID=UPI001C73B8E0|nr:SH3 domain-containing protein [Oscillochloris sp. ZM17-4]MBX0330372.1 SH3 domain-containing protein [Oscillochloris sp. ZM17-4]